MLVLLAVFAYSSDYKVCIYDTKSESCPSVVEAGFRIQMHDIPTKFGPALIPNPVDIHIYIVDSMVDGSVLDFSSLNSKEMDITLIGVDGQKSIILNIEKMNESVKTIDVQNIIIKSSDPSMTKFVTTTLHAENVIFSGISQIDVDHVDSELSSLIGISDIWFNEAILSGSLAGLPNSWGIRLWSEADTQIILNDFDNNTEICLLGNELHFSNIGSFHSFRLYLNYYLKNLVKIVHSKNDNILSLSSLARGPHLFNPLLEVTLCNNSILAFPPSFWPVFKEAVITINRIGESKIIISEQKVPIKITESHSPLTIIPQSELSGIYGSLSVSSNEITIEAPDNLINRTFIIENLFTKKGINMKANGEKLEVFIGSFSSEHGDDHHLEGTAHYRFKVYPEALCTFHISNMNIHQPKAFEMAHLLTSSSTIFVDNHLFIAQSMLVIRPRYIDEATDPEIESHIGESLPLFCSKAQFGNNIKIDYKGISPSRGFSLGNEIYEPTIGHVGEYNCLQITMTKNISNVGYQFCINPHSLPKKCKEGFIELNSLDDFNSWNQYLSSPAEQIEFEIYDTIEGSVFNFSKYTKEKVTLSITNRNETMKEIWFSSDVLVSNVRSISLNNVKVFVEPQWTGYINSNLYLKNVMWDVSVAEKMKVAYWMSISADEFSYRQLPVLYPKELTLNGVSHDYALLSNGSVTLNSSTGNTLKIPIHSKYPKLFLTLTSDMYITKDFYANEISSMQLESSGNYFITLDGNWPIGYSGIVLDTFSAGSIKSTNGVFPIEIVASTDYTVDSSVSNIEFVGSITMDASVHFINENTQAYYKYASFGKYTDISMAENSMIKCSVCYISDVNRKHAVKSLQLIDFLGVESGTYFVANHFTFYSDQTSVISITFRFGSIPYLRLDRKYGETYSPRILKIQHKREINDEKTLLQNKDSYINHEFPMICGYNLGCNNWNYYSESGLRQVKFDFSCKQHNTETNFTCMNLKVIFTDTPLPPTQSPNPTANQDGNKYSALKTGVIVLLIVGIILIAVYEIRLRNLSNIAGNDDPLLLSDDSITKLSVQ